MFEDDAMTDAKTMQKCSLFGGLPEEQIENILLLMNMETFKPGDNIIIEGTPNDKIFFLMEGRVSVIRKEKIIYDLTEGNTFGEMEVLDIMPSAATIRAVNDVKVMSISNRSLRVIYNHDLKSFTLLLMNLARDVSRRLRVANEIIIDGKIFDSYSSNIFTQD